MTMKIHTILITAALGSAFIVAGCGSTPLGSSGYLSDYSRLAKNPEATDDPNAKVWIAPDNALLDYDRLLIEPYSLRPKRGSWLEKIDRGNARELVDDLRSRMIATVDPYYAVVSEPGEGVLRLRVAITDLEFREGSRDASAAQSISFECEFLDSRTGEQLAAATRTFGIQDQANAYDALSKRLLSFMNAQHGIDE